MHHPESEFLFAFFLVVEVAFFLRLVEVVLFLNLRNGIPPIGCSRLAGVTALMHGRQRVPETTAARALYSGGVSPGGEAGQRQMGNVDPRMFSLMTLLILDMDSTQD